MYLLFFFLSFFSPHHQKQHDECLKTDQHLITTYWDHLIEMANTNRKVIIATFEEKLHAKNMMHFRNLGLIFFQESMQMSASEFLQKMDSPPSPFPNSNSFSSLSPSPLPKRTKLDIPAQSIIDLTDSPPSTPSEPICCIDLTNSPIAFDTPTKKNML